MSGFVLTTQLSISQAEVTKIKQQLNGGKGISPFTINLKLNLDVKEVAKIDKKLTSEFGVRPVEIHLTASRTSYKNIKGDIQSFTSLRPIPITFTASPYSYKLVRDKINAAFKSGKLAIFRVPFLPKGGSIKAIRKHFQDSFDKKPLKATLAVSRSSLSAMRTQIQSYFAKTPVLINARLGNVTQKAKNPNASFGSNFQPQNKSQASGVKIAKSLEHYGTFTAAVGTFVSLFRAMDNAVKEAVKFDREMVRISQVTGVSVAGLKDLKDEVSKVSKEFGVSSSDILKSAVTLSQAGLSATDTKIALEAIAKTGVSATFGDINDTTEASIAIFQQFGKQASDLENILSSVNKVSGAFAVESEDITVAVRRAGGAFKAAGGNFNEFMALFTSVRQTTRESAESIATGFRTIFARLQRTSTQNFLKQLDIDLLDEGQFVGPYEAIKRISEALKDVQTTDPKFAQIVEELGGFRQVSKVIPLLQQFTVSERALQIALRGGNSLTEDAVLSQQSLEVQLNKLKQEFLDTVRAFSNDSAIKSMISQMIHLSTSVLEVVRSLSSLSGVIGAVGLLAALPKGKQVGKGIRGYFGFASGGQVPGSGNSDTVPAMLTPGEFVLNKKAVKRIGLENLKKANVQHFANGGLVYDDKGVVDYNKLNNSISGNISNKKLQSLLGSKDPSFINKVMNNLSSKTGRALSTTKNGFSLSAINLDLISSVLDSINPGWRNGSLVSSRDIKKAFPGDSDEVIFSKLKSIASKNRMQLSLHKHDFPSQEEASGRLSELLALDSKSGYKGKDRFVGVGFKKFASGGHVGGSGNGDTVPAMLTPGEFVLTKNTVKNIGVNNLHNLNNSGKRKGYNKGGVVQHFAGGGIVNTLSNPGVLFGASLLLPIITNLGDTSKEVSSEFKKLTNSVGSAIIQFGIFSSIIGSIKDSYKDNKLFKSLTPQFTGSTGSKTLDNNIIDASIAAKRDLHSRLIKKYGPGGTSPNSTKLASKFSRGDSIINSSRDAAFKSGFINRQERISNYAMVGGAVASATGGYLLDNEREKIARGEGNAYVAGGAGFLQGAGAGAMIGSIFGPWGIAIGVATGGLASFYTTLTDASEEIKKVDIDKSFSELDSRLKKVFSGKLSVSDQSSFVADTIREQSRNIGQLSGQRRFDALARFKNDQSGIEKFFESVARGSANIDDFNNKTKSTLSTFSFLSSIPFNELNDNIIKIIESTQKANERIKESQSVIKSELDSRVRLIELEGAINSAFSGMSNLDRVTNNIGKGSYKSFDIDEILKDTSSGRFSNKNLVKKLVGNIGQTLGEFSEEDTNSLKSVIDIPSKLPKILNKVYSQDKLGSSGSFIDRFSKEIDKEFIGIGPDVKRSILASLNDIIGEEGQESNLFEKIIEDMENVVDKLSKSTKPLFDSFGMFAKKIQEEEGKLIDSLSLYRSIVDKISETEQKTRDAERDRIDFFNSLSGIQIGLGDIVSRRQQDLSGRFGRTDSNRLFGDFLDNKNQLAAAERQREGVVGDISKFNELTIQISKLKQATDKASTGLEDIASDSSGYIQSLKQLIDKTRQETQVRSDFAKTLASGSREDRTSLSKDIYNTALVARANNLNAIPTNEQDSVIQFLRKQGNLQVFGKRGEDFANELQIKSVIQNSLGLIGPELAKQLIENKPKEVNDILAELNVAYNEQRIALEAINTGLKSDSDKLKDAVDNSAANIIKTLRDIQKANETSRIENKRNELGTQKTGLETKLDAINRVNDITGLGTDLNGINKARSLLTISKDIKERESGRKSLLSLDPLKGVKFGANETTEGVLSRIESDISKSITGFDFSNKVKTLSQSERYNRKNLAEKESAFGNVSRSEYLFQLMEEEFRAAKTKAFKEADENILNSKSTLKSSGFTNVGDVDELSRLFKIIGEDNKSSADSLIESIDKLRLQIEAARLPGLASGGLIGGTGNKDSVPAMLMPGEFVLNKKAVKSVGVNNLNRFNDGNVGHFSTGNFVGTILEIKRNKAKLKEEDRLRKQKAYNSYQIQSVERERNRLEAEGLKKQKVAEQKRQAAANAKSQQSRGEHSQLRDYKSSLFFNSLPKKTGPKLTSYNLTPEEESVRAAEFHNKAIALQKRYEDSKNIGITAKNRGDARDFFKNIQQEKSIDSGVYSSITQSYNPSKTQFKPINFANKPQQQQQIIQQSQSVDQFKEFNQRSVELSTALNNFSTTMTITANHKVEVIFNGAEVLSKINESVAGIAVNEVAKQLDAYAVKNGLPRPNNVVSKGGK